MCGLEIGITAYLIVCPLVFLAGLVDAVGGGGGLISLPAYLFAGLPAHAAVATNKLSSAVGTAASTARYMKHGCVDWYLAVPGAAAALAGAQIGSRLALLVDDAAFRIVLLVLVPLVGVYTLLRRDLEGKERSVPRRRQLALVAVTTLAIGMYDGFYGPGTGTFLLLVYTGLCGMNVREASGNMKLANLSSNVSALAVFLLRGAAVIPLGLTAAAFSIAGHYIGAGLAIRKGSKIVRPAILCVIVLLTARLLKEIFF